MNSNLKIPPKLRQKIERELEPGELINWIEQPLPCFWTVSSLITMLFAIPWTSFSVFWIWAALGFQVPTLKEGIQPQYLFAMFGIPFVLIGLGMLLSPLWVWRTARQTVYIITNQRAISIQCAWLTTIRSYLPDQLKDVYRQERRDGSGDVIIMTRRWKDHDGDHRKEELGFLGVRNVQQVEKLLKRLAQHHS